MTSFVVLMKVRTQWRKDAGFQLSLQCPLVKTCLLFL
jgi:hypothetical protein